MEERRTRTWGRAPKEESARQRHVISVRLTDAELEELDRQRAGIARGAYVRSRYLGNTPPVIPEVNREAWAVLARAAANLNQITRKINLSGESLRGIDLEALTEALAEFRNALIGAKRETKNHT